MGCRDHRCERMKEFDWEGRGGRDGIKEGGDCEELVLVGEDVEQVEQMGEGF